MKKLDFVIIVILILLSFVPELVFALRFQGKYLKTYAEIKVNGTVYKDIQLSAGLSESFTVKTDAGENKVEIKDGKVRIADADCPDKICIKAGAVSKPGQILVCLPHKLIVEIKGDAVNDTDAVAY